MGWIGRIFGSVASPNGLVIGPSVDADAPTGVAGSLQVRHVDAGSCNGCEVEISGRVRPGV